MVGFIKLKAPMIYAGLPIPLFELHRLLGWRTAGKQCRLLHLAWFGADQNSQAAHVREAWAPCVYLPIYLLIIFFMCVRY